MLTHYKFNSVDELEKNAKNVLDKPVFDFIAGGAGKEWGVTNNIGAFNGYQIVPRILQDVSNIDTSIDVLGTRINSPVMVSPCAFHKLVNINGELATAKGCADAKTIMTLSTMSSYSIEETADASAFPKWFQLYIFKDREITKSLIRRAENSGYKAIVVTADVPAMGLRLRDIKNNFSLPPTVEAANFKLEKLNSLSEKTDGSKIKEHTDQQFDSSLTWESIDWLHSITSLPIIIKGILNQEDALESLNHNVSGIIVSNHGGRQIDSIISSIDALPNITQVIKNRIPVFVDGGIRSGEDIFKALALGANAVLIARPIMWALATGGEKQVTALLNKLQSELMLTMRLTGCKDLNVIKERGLTLLTGPSIFYRKILELEAMYKQLPQNDLIDPEIRPLTNLSFLKFNS